MIGITDNLTVLDANEICQLKQMKPHIIDWLHYRHSLCQKAEHELGQVVFGHCFQYWQGSICVRCIRVTIQTQPSWVGLSYIPRNTLAQPQAAFLKQTQHPMGHWLYEKDSDIKRLSLQIIKYHLLDNKKKSDHTVLHFLKKEFRKTRQSYSLIGYGRRHIFNIEQTPFYLIELFHPLFFDQVSI